MNDVVARFAPSPTGFLHIGGIRTALINYIYVQKLKSKNINSKFLLRIEDTDKERSKKEYVESIKNGLKWLGLNWDEKEFIQSERIQRHKDIANALFEKRYAFKCICDEEQLEKKRKENKKNHSALKKLCTTCKENKKIQNLKENYCIRIDSPSDGEISVTDKIQGKITIQNKEIDNYILLRKNGLPTYMLSVVVDDNDMKVNTIIRGNDHLTNTFRQIQIYKYMNWQIPEYAHLPLIHGTDGAKLSKRHGAIDINEFKKKGYLPQSIINNLILLGWSPKKNDELIEIDEIINNFEIGAMSKSASIFDYERLNFLNNHYLKKQENYEFFEFFIKDKNLLKSFFNKDKKMLIKIFNIYKENISFYLEIENIAKIYYNDSHERVTSNLFDENFNFNLRKFMIELEKIYEWNQHNISVCIKEFLQNNKIKFMKFGKPIRLILTNLENGPSISDILYILDKKNSFTRLNNYIKSIE